MIARETPSGVSCELKNAGFAGFAGFKPYHEKITNFSSLMCTYGK